MAQPNSTDFLALPIVGTDLVALFRNGDISKPRYVTWARFLAILQSEISGGSSYITSIANTSSINLSVVSGTLSAVLTNVGTAGTYGDATNVPQFTVDSQGRITGVTLVPITAGVGTVTSVGLSGSEFTFTGSPITTSGTIGISLAASGVSAGNYGSSTQVPVITVNNKGIITSITTAAISGGSGTVTSVALTLPTPSNPAFSVTGSPITSSGTFAIAANGTTSQVVLGDGSLASIETVRGLPISMYLQESYLGSTGPRNVEYVPSLGKLYIANNGAGTVTIVNVSTGQTLGTVTAAGANKLKYIASTDEVYVTSTSTASIFRISGSSNSLNTTITGSITANGYDILEISSTKVYISVLAGTGRIMVINPSISTALAWVTDITSSVPAFPAGMAYNQNGSSSQNGFVIVAANAGFFIVNPSTNSVTTTIANPSSAISGGRDCVYSPSLDKYFIASTTSGSIGCFSIASATTLSLDSTIYQAYNVTSLGLDETNGYLFACVITNNSAGSGTVGIKAIPYGAVSAYAIGLTGLVGGGSSIAGVIAMDTLNNRIFAIGSVAGIVGQAVALKYIV